MKSEGNKYKLVNVKTLDTVTLFIASFTGFVTLVLTYKLSSVLYLERGYFAVGGEVVIIAAVMVLLPCLLWKAANKWII